MRPHGDLQERRLPQTKVAAPGSVAARAFVVVPEPAAVPAFVAVLERAAAQAAEDRRSAPTKLAACRVADGAEVEHKIHSSADLLLQQKPVHLADPIAPHSSAKPNNPASEIPSY